MTKREEREIRRKRRAIRRADRERRRAERLVRMERHEKARNGGPIICAPQEASFAALRTYNPLCFCVGCETIKRADFMFDEKTCLACHDGE